MLKKTIFIVISLILILSIWFIDHDSFRSVKNRSFAEILPELDCKNVDFEACTVIVPLNNCRFLANQELLIMGYLAKNKHNILEFGMGQGKTTFTMAKNSPSDAKITTINFLKSMSDQVSLDKNNDLKEGGFYTLEHGYLEGAHKRYHFEGTDVAYKINVINADSKRLDLDQKVKFDLIFIDGAHIYSYVKADTEKAFDTLAKGGIIVWDDYNLQTPDVYNYLEELAKSRKLFNIRGTKLVIYKDES